MQACLFNTHCIHSYTYNCSAAHCMLCHTNAAGLHNTQTLHCLLTCCNTEDTHTHAGLIKQNKIARQETVHSKSQGDGLQCKAIFIAECAYVSHVHASPAKMLASLTTMNDGIRIHSTSNTPNSVKDNKPAATTNYTRFTIHPPHYLSLHPAVCQKHCNATVSCKNITSSHQTRLSFYPLSKNAWTKYRLPLHMYKHAQIPAEP